MTTAILLFIIIGIIIMVLFFCTVAGMFYYRNLRLEKVNESLSDQLSKFQAIEQSRKLENIEVVDRMLADLEREELIYMNTM